MIDTNWEALADEAERELGQRRARLIDRAQFERKLADALEQLRRHIARMRDAHGEQAADIATEGLEQFERIVSTALSGEPERNPSLHKTGDTHE